MPELKKNGTSRNRNSSFNQDDDEKFTYETFMETSQYLSERARLKPRIGIICGSGLGAYWEKGALAEALLNKQEFPYEEIPNFPRSTVEGHAGKLVFGELSGIPVVCMQGRFHYFEGYPLWKCAMPVRIMKLLGVEYLIATNAAGGLSDCYEIGDFMMIKDHINLMGFAGNNPLQGPNEERFGPRFPPMNQAYSRELIKAGKEIAQQMGIADHVHEGVYTCLGGPNFETVAELRMLKTMGADAVGMSTAHEVITARHCNMTVFAFSLITNKCVTEYEEETTPNHEEVMDVGKLKQSTLKEFVTKIVERIADVYTK